MPPPGASAAIVSVAQALEASNAPTASFLPFRPRVALLVQGARAAMQRYTQRLQPLCDCVLQKRAHLPAELVVIVWSYLA